MSRIYMFDILGHIELCQRKWYCHFHSRFQDLISGLKCSSRLRKWPYGLCREVEYIPAHAHTLSQLSSDWIMHSGSTLLPLRLQFRPKINKKIQHEEKAVFIVSAPMPAVSGRGSRVSLYTQARAVYQARCDGRGFVLSTQQTICDWGALRAPNTNLKSCLLSLPCVFLESTVCANRCVTDGWVFNFLKRAAK